MNMFSQETVEFFSSFEITFWAILHQTHVIITCVVPNAAGNYKLCVY